MKIATVLASMVLVGGCLAQEVHPPCVAVDSSLMRPATPLTVLRFFGKESSFWPNGSILRVRFLEGGDRLKSRVWAHFKKVDALCGITLTQVESGESEIRVSFRMSGAGSGHWSYLGKDCLSIAQNRATMNLSLSAWDFESDVRRAAVHELLHALGAVHENSHPAHEIKWDVPAVLAAYKKTQGWSADTTRRQVLKRETSDDFWGSGYDKDSIMAYQIPKAYLLDKSQSVKWNTKMSLNDVRWLQKRYPIK